MRRHTSYLSPTGKGLLAALAVAATLMIAGIAAHVHGDELPRTLPDLTLTPGVARKDLTEKAICSTKWGKDERHVTEAMKAQVFKSYGMTGNNDPKCVADSHGRRCEIDHLISRELGGADDVKNLWPEPYGTKPWNAAVKDKLENRLHVEVCAGKITLEDARSEIVTDWTKAFVKRFGEPASQ